MIVVTFDLTKASADEMIIGNRVLDQLRNSMSFDVLQVNVIEKETSDTLDLPFGDQ